MNTTPKDCIFPLQRHNQYSKYYDTHIPYIYSEISFTPTFFFFFFLFFSTEKEEEKEEKNAKFRFFFSKN